MATVGYVRVSTVKQVDEGESLDVQQRTIAGYALMHGLAVDQVFVERGVSGSKPLADRPQGAVLLAAIRPGDIIVTPKLDRMFRSALDALAVLGDLRERGISLHMIDLGGDVTSNGVSKLVFTILSAVAEAERDRTRERVAEVKRDQRTRGRYLVASRRSASTSARGVSWSPIRLSRPPSSGCAPCGPRGYRSGPSPRPWSLKACRSAFEALRTFSTPILSHIPSYDLSGGHVPLPGRMGTVSRTRSRTCPLSPAPTPPRSWP
jgi:putative DNA-invertase from lambdoid prophage Rac